MFKFKKVASKNFLSFEEVELNLENRGLILIEGDNKSNQTFTSNGSGKSSVLSQITYALFGQTPSGIKADDVVNRSVGKNMQVIMEVEVDGRNYRIERYRKHSKHKNKVKLFLEEEELTGKSAKETDAMIQELFGIDYPTYMNSIVQGQGDSEVFSQATDKGKKEILENITNIAIYKKAQDIAKQESSEITGNLADMQVKIEKANASLETVKALEQQEKEGYAHTEEMIKDTEQRIGVAQEALATLKNDRSITTLEQSKAELAGAEAPTQMPEKGAKEQELETSLVGWNTQASDIRAQTQQSKQKVQQMKQQQADLDTQTVCNYCGSPLDATHAKKEFERLAGEIVEVSAQADKTNALYTEQLMPMLTEMEALLVSMKKEREQEYFTAQQLFSANQQKLFSIDTQINNHYMRVRNDEQAIETMGATLAQLNNVPKPEPKVKRKQEIQNELDGYSKDLVLMTDEKEQYEDVVKLFSNSGIRSVVLDLVTPFLNERANKYLATLSGSDIEINFTTQVANKDGSLADRFDIEIVNQSGGETYKSNSEGEKKRIDLAISFALQDLVLSKTDMQTNLAIYDECFDALDAVGCENVITILKEKQAQIGSIFVITHNAHLVPLFEELITVRKEGGVSKIIEENS